MPRSTHRDDWFVQEKFKDELMKVRRGRMLRALLMVVAAAGFCGGADVHARVVRMVTSAGNIDTRLFDTATPLSVTNFMNYVTSNRYDGTFFHRVPQAPSGGTSDFVVQGGGFKLNNSIFQAAGITTDPVVQNEPGISNVRGTLSYAKGSSPNSATSQFFFNISDNLFLNNPPSLFTAFGRVVGTSMTVVDAINDLPVINAAGAENAPGEDFDEIPVFNVQKVVQQNDITNEDAVMVNDVFQLNIPDGDYNFDGRVNNADLAIWKADFGSLTKGDADGNGNGRVDGGDFLVWQRTLGQNFGIPGAAPAVHGVPEPGGLVLAAFALGAAARRRRRR
jgi:peptidyl-prolyl cis-trans isomerase A (cyclophilin A)